MEQSTKDFFKKIIGAKSVSSTDPAIDTSNKKACDVVSQMLEEYGFSIQTQQVPKLTEKYNILASIGPEQPNKGLLLAGHTDTVPTTESLWTHDPYTVTEVDGKLYGLGTCDMKGFFAVIHQALSQVDLSKLKHPLQVWATAEEEVGMVGARHLITEDVVSCEHAVVGEPTSLIPLYGHKGGIGEQIVIHGKAGHSSVPAMGASAVEAMINVATALRNDLTEITPDNTHDEFNPAEPTLNFGMIEGGDSFNRVADKCRLWLDRRIMPGEDFEKIRKRMREVATNACKTIEGTSIEFTPLFNGINAVRTNPDSEIVKFASELSGNKPNVAPYATEAPYYAQLGMDVVVMGAGSIDVIHQPDEYVPIADIDTMSSYVVKMIEKFCLHG